MELDWKLMGWCVKVIKSCKTADQLNNFYRLLTKKFNLPIMNSPLIIIGKKSYILEREYKNKLMSILHDKKLDEDLKKLKDEKTN